MALKDGRAEKNVMCKGGGHQEKLTLTLVVIASVIMQTSVPECQKKAFLRY